MDEEGADVEDEDSGRNEKKDSGKMSAIHFLLLKLDWDSQHQYYIKYIRSIHRQNGMLNFVKISRNRMTTVVLIALNKRFFPVEGPDPAAEFKCFRQQL